jgi:hypothetical protein
MNPITGTRPGDEAAQRRSPLAPTTSETAIVVTNDPNIDYLTGPPSQLPTAPASTGSPIVVTNDPNIDYVAGTERGRS